MDETEIRFRSTTPGVMGELGGLSDSHSLATLALCACIARDPLLSSALNILNVPHVALFAGTLFTLKGCSLDLVHMLNTTIL